MRTSASVRLVLFGVVIMAALAGCGGSGSTSTSAFSSPTAKKSAVLSVSGSPGTTVSVGQSYSFTPSVSNGGGTPSFAIKNAPSWATFNSKTGKLSGTPTSADAGTYSNIVITVADGGTTASLPAFSITVAEANSGPGSADVSWTPPTTTANGATLTNLAGYDIYYGTSPTALTQKVQVSNVGVTNYVVSGLTSGTWYFVVTAYTSSGAQSVPSNVVSKVI